MTARLIAAITGLALVAGPQGADDQTRQIIAEEFLKARPAPPKPTQAKPPVYKPSAGSPKSGKPAVSSVNVGLTLWRLRPSKAAEEGARLLVQDSAPGDLTAERIDTGTPLSLGDRIRLSIESPRAGFLYVIDREVYQDGTTSDPYLIFPTTRTRQGDNEMRGGRLVDIPDQQDRPNYFTVRPSRPGQVGEQLTIMVTPTRVDRITIGDKPLMLARDLVASWEKSWAAPVQQFAQEGGVARVWTREEQAAADRTRLLTQDDPAPQTIFRVAVQKGAAVLIDVRLPYATSNR